MYSRPCSISVLTLKQQKKHICNSQWSQIHGHSLLLTQAVFSLLEIKAHVMELDMPSLLLVCFKIEYVLRMVAHKFSFHHKICLTVTFKALDAKEALQWAHLITLLSMDWYLKLVWLFHLEQLVLLQCASIDVRPQRLLSLDKLARWDQWNFLLMLLISRLN